MGDTDRWNRAKPILDRALLLDAPERAEYIDRVCGPEPTLCAYLKELIAVDEDDLKVFDDPVLTLLESAFLDETLHPGDTLDKYLIEHLLGQGGMGRVYAAVLREKHFQKRVAIKILDRAANHDELLRRFRQECHILAKLNHPHIARILDGGFTASGQPYMVMERVEGTDLMTYLKTNPLELDALLRLFEKICDAVQFAHRNLIVHRDLKPGNVLVTSEGEPTLLDFGISKLLNNENQTGEHTRPEARLMTPEYASPEQWTGQAVTTASDVYALGVLLFQALTGKRPHDSAQNQPNHFIHFSREAPPASSKLSKSGLVPELGPGAYPRRLVRGDLDAIVAMALAIQPDNRYGSPTSLADDLRHVREGHPVTAERITGLYVARKFFKRHRLTVSLLGLFSLGLLILMLALLWQRNATIQALNTAQRENRRSQQLNSVVLDLFRKPNPYQRTGANLTVKELIDNALFEMKTDTLEQVEIKTELLLTSGQALIGMGLLEEASARLAQAEYLAKTRLPAKHSRIANILAIRGGNFLFLSQLESGQISLQEALAHQDRYLPKMHPDRVRTYQYLGYLGLNSRDYQQGRLHLEKALLIHEQYPNRDDLEPYLTHSILGRTLSRLGENDLALFHHQESHYLASKQWGYEHPTMVETLNSFSNHFYLTQDFALSEILFEESLRIQESRFRPCHPLLVYTRGLTADLFINLNRLPEAEALYLQNLTCGESDSDACFSAYVMAWNNMGYIWQLQGRWQEGDAAYQRFHGLTKETFGEHSFPYGKSFLNIAWSAYEQGQDIKARHWYQQGYNHLQAAGFGEGYQANMALASLSEMDAKEGKFPSALERIDRALPRLITIMGADHPEVIALKKKRASWASKLNSP